MNTMFRYTKIVVILVGTFVINISAAEYTFSFKNKSPRDVQIELVQQLKSVTPLNTVQAGQMYTANINISEPTKMYLYYCPDNTWCKTLKSERMTAIFNPKKQIHISFNGKKLRPQLKRLQNIGSGDIRLIK